jgi:ATP-binding cassette subfamily B protein
MNKLKETIATLLLAARYSFSFCWRNSKKETIGRLTIAAISTALLYLGIQATGLIINEVQNQIGTFAGFRSFADILQSDLAGPLALFVGVLVLGAVLSRFNWYFRSKWNQSLRFANLRELNDRRAKLDVARFKSKEYDDLQKRIQELPTSWQTRIWFSEEMLTLFTTLVSFGIFGASLIWHNPFYALILVLTALPLMFVEFRLVNMWWNLFLELVPHHKQRSVLEKPYHNANIFVQALMFGQMPTLRNQIDKNVDSVLGAYDKIRRLSVRNELLTHIIAVAGLTGVVLHAVWFTVTHAGGEIGTLTIIIAAARTFQGNLEAIVSLVAEQWNSAKGVILIEKDFLGLKPVLKTDNPVVPVFNNPPLIRFENVSFAYPNTDTLVIKDVSFTIEPGKKVAIVGQSGNGKSTLQALLMRYYDPTSGNIFADNYNLRNIEPNVWNNTASSLTQEYSVLERTIAAEIASSRLDQPIDLEAVTAASRFANFDQVVADDPKGYDSQIGVEFGGRDFSGGEKQRLALARVWYRGSLIYILDEPDAKLDPESAQKVIDEVMALKGITVVMITHHVSRAERCDKVIVMGKGEVAEQGTHAELMANKGPYSKMFEKDKKRLGAAA